MNWVRCPSPGSNGTQTATLPCSYTSVYFNFKGWFGESAGANWSSNNATPMYMFYQVMASGQINLSSVLVGTRWMTNLFCIGY